MVEAAARRVLMVGGDLMARSRVEAAASASGVDVDRTTPAELPDALAARPYDLVIVDLDAAGAEALRPLEAARSSGAGTARVVGYFSHVDAALGEAARRAGCEALPRGRFWRGLSDLVGRPEPS